MLYISLNLEFSLIYCKTIASRIILLTITFHICMYITHIIFYRREILANFFEKHNITLLSLSSPFILGTENHIQLKDHSLIEEIKANNGDLEKVNKYS